MCGERHEPSIRRTLARRPPLAVPNPRSRRRAGGAAALLELLAAAARTVVVAADFWRQARLAGNARMVAPAAQQPFAGRPNDAIGIFAFGLEKASLPGELWWRRFWR